LNNINIRIYRSLEKRKAAALEIQREIEELVQRKDEAQIEAKIKQFDLCTQEEITMRKRAGLYGISVVTVALYQKVSVFIQATTTP
jgi:hypothetical protein